LQRGPRFQDPGPRLARAIRGLLPQEPNHAGWLDADQDRAAVKEDLIETADQHQASALDVEVLEDASGHPSGRLDPAPQGAATGARLRTEDQSQEDEDLVAAQTHRDRRDSELLLFGVGELDGLSQPLPELSVLLAETLVVLDQFGTRRPPGVFGLDCGMDLSRVVVDGLSATVDIPRLVSDIAIRAGPARGRIGDPNHDGYLEHGG
jgi:hypothetical protein